MKPSVRAALPILLLAASMLHASASLAAPSAAGASARPRNVIFMIPDGCGPATFALARMVAGRPLMVDRILTGAVTTASEDARVTDSAAGATAYATGHKTYNGGISEDARHQPLGTLLEAAQAKGLATGLVVTSRLTHATPAAFAAHVDERASEGLIAAQMVEHHVDVLLGGGRGWFVPKAAGGLRDDGRDLLAEARAAGVEVVVDRDGLDRAQAATRPGIALHVSRAAPVRGPDGLPPLLGLFAMDHLEFAIDADSVAQPHLAAMTRAALERLSRAPRGFFLMVEGSRIDHAAHANDVAATVREVLEYDDAVGVALEFARRDGNTLVVCAADHETGGLTLGREVGGKSRTDLSPEAIRVVHHSVDVLARRLRQGEAPDALLRAEAGIDSLGADERAMLAEGLGGRRALDWDLGEIESRRARIGWTTHGHTAADVGLYASGPGRDRFVGLRDNTEVARGVAALLGLDLDAATARLRTLPARREPGPAAGGPHRP